MKYQFSICRTISTFVILFIIVASIMVGTSSNLFINVPQLLIPIGLCFFMMLAVYGIEYLKFIPHSLRILFCMPLEPNQRFAQIALFGSRSVIGAGLIGMVIGIIQLLSNLAGPWGLGYGMAISLVCPFYTIVISEVFFAIVYQSFKDAKTQPKSNTTLPFFNAGLPIITILFSLAIFIILLLCTMDFTRPDTTATIQNMNKFRTDCPKAAYWLDYDTEHIVDIRSDITLWMGNTGVLHFEALPKTYTIDKVIQHANANGWTYHLSVKLTEEHFDAYSTDSYLDDFSSEAYKAAQVIRQLKRIEYFQNNGCTILAFETGNFQGWASYIIISNDLSEMLVFFNSPQHPDQPHEFWLPEGFTELNKIQTEQEK